MTEKTFKTLAAPGLLASMWAITIAVAGVAGYSMSEVASIFWVATCIAIASFLIIICRNSVTLLALYGIPFAASSVVMLPWIYRGATTFPGTWFWDGWAYLAFAQSFLRYPLDTHLPAIVSPVYELGISLFKTRFITAGLLALFSASPVSSGETQSAAGFLLLFYVFTFACSIGALGTVLFPTKPGLRLSYVVFATLSGYVTTMLHANNYDQLFSMALVPLTVALAIRLQWNSLMQAAILGIVCAGMLAVYPELAPANLGMPAVVIIWRIWRESPDRKAIFNILAVGAAVFVVTAFPTIYSLSTFFIHQFLAGAAAYDPNKARPGENYFLQFYYPRCAAGALWSLFPPMTLSCKGQFASFAGPVGAVLSMVAIYGALRWPRKMAAILLCAILPLVAGLVMLVVNKYDYGAYKLFAVGFPFWAALVIFAVSRVRVKWGKTVVLAASVCYFALIGLRLWHIDDAAKFKTIEVFRGPIKNIPAGSTIALRIADHLAYQWAAYYLRDNNIITVEGSLAYLPAPKSARPDGDARYLITDTGAAACWGAPLSRSEAYSVFEAPGQGDCSP